MLVHVCAYCTIALFTGLISVYTFCLLYVQTVCLSDGTPERFPPPVLSYLKNLEIISSGDRNFAKKKENRMHTSGQTLGAHQGLKSKSCESNQLMAEITTNV